MQVRSQTGVCERAENSVFTARRFLPACRECILINRLRAGIRRNDNRKKNVNHKVATPRHVIPANAGIYGIVDSFVVDSCMRRNDIHK